MNSAHSRSPVVSAIVPAYNSDAWIGQAIDSVLAQTYRPIEILVVDDGSTDNTQAVLSPYVAQGQIRYFRQDNQGPGQARNAGVSKATGKYVAFLDSDDLWLPEKTERQVQTLESDPQCKAVLCESCAIDCAGDELGRTTLSLPAESKDLIVDLFLGKIRNFTSTTIADREAFLEVGGFPPLPQMEDFLFLMRMASQHRIRHLADPLAKKRHHANHTGGAPLHEPQAFERYYTPFLDLAIREFPFLAAHRRHAASRLEAIRARRHLARGNRLKALGWATRAYAHRGSVWAPDIFAVLLASLAPFPASTIKQIKIKIEKLFHVKLD